MKYIKPEIDLAHILPKVQMPGRYTGGEYGIVPTSRPGDLLTAICFPDLYEIGMSNTAIKLLYAQLNSMDNVHCERVFTPAPDFEELLRQSGIPLYTLESGIPLQKLDMLGFSVGYELSATNILSTLELGHISIRRSDRSSNDPLVIGGGPALTNPEPFAEFFDAIYIGEAEESLESIVQKVKYCKAMGADRQDILKELQAVPAVWMPEKEQSAKRVLWHGFDTPRSRILPVPNISVVQDHGVVEIMRGCPNGCRFCHAGYFYRPKREKDYREINQRGKKILKKTGYDTLSLLSLSSMGYSKKENIFDELSKFTDKNILSLEVPSTRIDKLDENSLDKLQSIKNSNNTLAIEAGTQRLRDVINKNITEEDIFRTVDLVKSKQLKGLKLYFMIGLPTETEKDRKKIVEIINKIKNKIGRLSVSISVFIPKVHTPFQWEDQINKKEIKKINDYLVDNIKRGIRLSWRDEFKAFLEGIF